jgi:hypothetical protein
MDGLSDSGYWIDAGLEHRPGQAAAPRVPAGRLPDRARHNWLGQWDDYETEPVSFQEAGRSKVLVEMAERGHLKRTGITLDESFSHSFTLEGRTVTEWRMYDSREQALEALGLG